MDIKDIKAIIDLMKKNSISDFELEKEDCKIKLRRSSGDYSGDDNGGAISMVPAPVPQAIPAQVAPALTPVAAPEAAPAADKGPEITAPMIGTFYRAPSPEAPSYVEVGTEVAPDTVVAIIEAMKVMNEIKSEVRGVVTEILVDNGKPVEFGQPLFRYRAL